MVTTSIGLIWFGISLVFLGNRSNNIKKETDAEQSQSADLLNSSVPVPASRIASVEVEGVTEAIYENDQEIFQKTQL